MKRELKAIAAAVTAVVATAAATLAASASGDLDALVGDVVGNNDVLEMLLCLPIMDCDASASSPSTFRDKEAT